MKARKKGAAGRHPDSTESESATATVDGEALKKRVRTLHAPVKPTGAYTDEGVLLKHVVRMATVDRQRPDMPDADGGRYVVQEGEPISWVWLEQPGEAREWVAAVDLDQLTAYMPTPTQHVHQTLVGALMDASIPVHADAFGGEAA